MFRAIYNFFNANIHFFFHISIKIIGKLFNILTILQLYTPFRAFLVAKLRKIWSFRHFVRWQIKNRLKFWRFRYFFVLLWSKSETKKGKTFMQTTANIENVSISIPLSDLSFLRTLSKKMGWKLKRPRKSGIERALDDIKAGRVYEAKSVDDLFEQLEQ